MIEDPDLTPSSAPLEPGARVGEYIIERTLGTGAFGTVYRAQQPVIDKPVAIKVLAMRYSVDPDMVARFIDEARAANRIDHAAIIDIFSFGRLPDGRRYCVMECLEGEPLDEYLESRGRLPAAEALRILRPIAAALDAAHAAGIAHRDIKPANIFACSSGPPKLLDFGVAKLMDLDSDAARTATGVAVGTPAYMAPEQCLGGQVDTRVDLYAFGVLTFRILAGRLPFEAESNFSMMAAHINDPPPAIHRIAPELSPAVSKVLRELMAKSADDRPDSAVVAVDALDIAFRGRRAIPWPAWAIGVAALVGVVAWLAWPKAPIQSPTVAPIVTAVEAVDAARIQAIDAAVDAHLAPDATVVLPVSVTLDALPPNAKVMFGDQILDVVDGEITLPQGDSLVELKLTAPGRRARMVSVTPSADSTLNAELARRRGRDKPQDKPVPPKPAGKPVKTPPGQHSLEPWNE